VFGWTIQPRLAGDWSMFPAASIARTSKWCVRTVSSVTTYGDWQSTNSAPSSAHSNVSSSAGVRLSGSEPMKVKVASGLLVVEGGEEVMIVCGATVSGGSSIVHAYSTGASSTTPIGFVACTWNTWPSASRPL
jgi:hypothetical protein